MADGSIAVLGTGSAGMRFLRLLRELDVPSIAISTRIDRSAEMMRDGFRVAASLRSEGVGDVAGAIIATDSGRHAADVLDTLDVVPNILVEKPMAVSRIEADRVVDACRLRGGRVRVATCLRHDMGLRWVRDRLGDLGSVQLVDAECLSWLPGWNQSRDYRSTYSARPGQGGVVLDMVHELDYLQWMFGALEVRGTMIRNDGVLGLDEAVEETACVLLRSLAGVPITLRLSFAIRISSRRLRVIGTSGALEWDICGGALLRDVSGAVLDSCPPSERTAMYRAQLMRWLASSGEHGHDGLSTMEEAADVASLCDSIRAPLHPHSSNRRS